jgi:hypothetical protein
MSLITEGYTLAVGATPWKCLTLVVTESANGEVSTIEFEVNNAPIYQGKTAYDLIQYGDLVYLSIYDSDGAEQQYLGRIWQKNPDDMYLHIIATMGDKILADRLVSSDYLNIDVGTALATIVTTDCVPLLAVGIPSPIGLIASLASKNKQALEAFQEVFRTFGLKFWSETRSLDWLMYLADPTKLTAQGIMVEFPMEEVS